MYIYTHICIQTYIFNPRPPLIYITGIRAFGCSRLCLWRRRLRAVRCGVKADGYRRMHRPFSQQVRDIVHIYRCMYVCVCMFVCIFTYMYIYLYLRAVRCGVKADGFRRMHRPFSQQMRDVNGIYRCLYVCVCTYVCISVCVYMYVYIRMYFY